MSIKQDIARSLINLVNTLPAMDALLEYVDYRIEQNQKDYENTNDFNHTLRIQGAIMELRRIKKLRDEVLASAE